MLANAKNSLVVLAGVVLFQDVVTPLQVLGYSISLGGFAWYQRLKMVQMTGGQAALDAAKQDRDGDEAGGKEEGMGQSWEREKLLGNVNIVVDAAGGSWGVTGRA